MLTLALLACLTPTDDADTGPDLITWGETYTCKHVETWEILENGTADDDVVEAVQTWLNNATGETVTEHPDTVRPVALHLENPGAINWIGPGWYAYCPEPHVNAESVQWVVTWEGVR